MTKVVIFGYGNVAMKLHKIIATEYCSYIVTGVFRSKEGAVDNTGLSYPCKLKKDVSWEMMTERADILIVATSFHAKFKDKDNIILAYLKSGADVYFLDKQPLYNAYCKYNEIAKFKKAKIGLAGVLGALLPTKIVLDSFFYKDKITKIEGVLNGTSNWLLDKMYEKEKGYGDICNSIANMGMAETNILDDVNGYDSARKLAISIMYYTNKSIRIEDFDVLQGIRAITSSQIKAAKEKNLRYRLIARYSYEDQVLLAGVFLELVDCSNEFYSVCNERKAIKITGEKYGEYFISGGASSVDGAARSVLREIELSLK